MPQYFEDEKRQDELAAVMALAAYREFAQGNMEDTKAELLRPIGMYYRLYRQKGGNPELISRIEEASQKYPDLAAELSRKIGEEPDSKSKPK
jgi:hypothetical protein